MVLNSLKWMSPLLKSTNEHKCCEDCMKSSWGVDVWCFDCKGIYELLLKQFQRKCAVHTAGKRLHFNPECLWKQYLPLMESVVCTHFVLEIQIITSLMSNRANLGSWCSKLSSSLRMKSIKLKFMFMLQRQKRNRWSVTSEGRGPASLSSTASLAVALFWPQPRGHMTDQGFIILETTDMQTAFYSLKTEQRPQTEPPPSGGLPASQSTVIKPNCRSGVLD